MASQFRTNTKKYKGSKQQVVWIISLGEPLPLPGRQVRLMRAGMIAKEFAARGADITWWTSTFSHAEKRYIAEQGDEFHVLNGVRLRFLHGRPYQRNVSLARMSNHREVARNFIQIVRSSPRPDLVFCCYPTIELAHAAVRIGKEFGIPVIVDVRDLWPEVFLDVTPLPRPLMRLSLTPLYRKARLTLAGATAITAITEPFLEKSLALAGRVRSPLDRVVPLAYERTDPTPQDRKSALAFWHKQGLKLDGSERIACAFGNLSNVPEFSTAVDALDHLAAELQKNLRMVICGSGDKLRWLKEQTKRHPQLIVPGRVGQAEIAVLMEHADAGLLVYPNRRDFLLAFPNKIGEYLSRNLPILSTLDGITGDLLRRENIGIVTPSGEPQAFADNLKVLLSKNNIRNEQTRQNAKRVYLKRFDSGKVHGGLLDYLYQDVLGLSDAEQYCDSRQNAKQARII